MDVFVPGPQPAPSPDPTANVVYRALVPAAALIVPDVRALLETGELVAVSVCARVDQGCTAAVLPSVMNE